MKGIVKRYSARSHGVKAQEAHPILKVKAVQLLFTEKVFEAINNFDSEFRAQKSTANHNYNTELCGHLDDVFELFLMHNSMRNPPPVATQRKIIRCRVKFSDELSVCSDVTTDDFDAQHRDGEEEFVEN